LDEDLTEFEKMGKLFYFPIVQAPDENWTLGTGRITHKMIEASMPPKNTDDSLILICGGSQLKAEVVQVLEEMDYKNYFVFS
jgi:NAD(P)H-flavin reductase